MKPEEKKVLLAKLSQIRKEISDIRAKLNELDDQKEAWFKKKESYSNEIRQLIGEIKRYKSERDRLTQEVKARKKKREELNSDVKTKVTALKELKKSGKDIAEKLNIDIPPDQLLSRIRKLEEKIETEVMSFDAEKGIMKQLRELKKKLKSSDGITKLMEKISAAAQETTEARKTAQVVHEEIQRMANESQVAHEKILENSKKVDNLVAQEKDAFQKFKELKDQMAPINEGLHAKVSELQSLMDRLNQHKVEAKELKKEKDDIFIKTKGEEVEDKLKRGKKLTTEDILIFQRMNAEKMEDE